MKSLAVEIYGNKESRLWFGCPLVRVIFLKKRLNRLVWNTLSQIEGILLRGKNVVQLGKEI